MSSYTLTAPKASVERTAAALKGNGFDVQVVANKEAALAAVKALVPQGSEVFTMSSITLETTGIAAELNGAHYKSVRDSLNSMNRETQGRDMRIAGATPDVAVGSVHAVTETGTLLIASLTGSQLPAYASGAGKVVFVVGTQKIVKDLDAAMDRLNNHVVALESARARKAYGLPDTFNSAANKILLFSRELVPSRVTVVLVEEPLGF